jgi:EAL domain-containing protein (putative c-di-GMP-specific phosphodiesterase class I)/FixJ family two-component response regulator
MNSSIINGAYVLDDEPYIAAIICKVLTACGLAPRQFTSATPFLSAVKDSPAELLVLDLALGQSDAIDIIRQLEVLKYQGKVLLISGRDVTVLNEVTRIGEKHGLAMLPPLKKPFRPADVRERLSVHVTGAARPKPPRTAAAAKEAGIDIAEALENNWLELWYQPKIDLKAFAICGAEALLRARHPKLGLLTPDRILPPAGDRSYGPLTEFVLRRAMSDSAKFSDQDVSLKLTINAPASVINTPQFIASVRSLLPSDPGFQGLIVEVTEDEVISDQDWAREVATQLKLYNVGLSIDDFGAGYASLSRLNDLPFVEVKIDRSFVSGCDTDKLKHALCQTVVDLAHRFGATACAEGVETTEELRALVAMQCDAAQGFLFAKPMPAAALVSTLRAALAGGSSQAKIPMNGLLQAQSA